ncbi:MAG: MOSC domain-containing protein [Hyphomicrobiaceae bacterium]
MSDEQPHVTQLYRYPVKGLTAEPLQQVALTVGEGLPFDRAYAIENGPGRFDPANPQHLPKIAFLMLMRDERLATIEARFDEANQTLSILRSGKQVARGDLRSRLGCSMIEQFFAAYMKGSLRGAPRVVSAPGHMFSDVATKCLHIVNLASVRDLERIAGRKIDPLRFRANVYVDGVEPWAELKWLDREIAIGDAKLAVFKRTQRCDATNVDPVTAARDMALPALLLRTWGHSDFGIYAKVTTAGSIAIGNTVGLS